MTRMGSTAITLALCFAASAECAPKHGTWGPPEPVEIVGYADHAMEPFISCDGQILLFNNRNGNDDQTDIHWAKRLTDKQFQYQGKVENANTGALDGVPTMDCERNLYFISTRSYFDTRSTIYRGKFDEGIARDVKLVEGLAASRLGVLNFDVEISADGQQIYAAEGTYDAFGGPWSADLFVAQRVGDRFFKNPHSERLLANINTGDREYAASLSHDGLELFFTRLSGWSIWPTLTIEYSARKTPNHAWPASTTISSITGFVEAPALAPDGKTLYFHKKKDDGLHRLFLVRRQ